MAEKLDPFDVVALERSLNNSAVRVSTIWLSYLLFALYLVIAAGTVTHRQLFLEDPVKLPVLNIDLPLWGFFFLAPILFVIFHGYVLLQVLLLGRTAVAYNEALDRAVKPPPANVAMRQRLANTLFAQIFAGSPREREGALGGILKLTAWITLAIAPVLVLLVFQFKFLPYHSHFVTWTHRMLIFVELATVLLLWPLALDARRDVEWRRLMRQPITLAAIALFVLVSVCLATFPGELHGRWLRQFPKNSAPSQSAMRPIAPQECSRSGFLVRFLPSNFDRIVLVNLLDVVDDERLAKVTSAAKQRGIAPHQTIRMHSFQNRDFRCGLFAGADLRHVDFIGASLIGADFEFSELQGASFAGAVLDGANLLDAKLQGAGFQFASLRGASLHSARIDGAIFLSAKLPGAKLDFASARGAVFSDAQLTGASIANAWFEAADFKGARLQAADLTKTDFSGSFFGGADLQTALIAGADLEASYLGRTQLQGADLQGSRLDHAEFLQAALWRTRIDKCEKAQVGSPVFEPSLVVRDKTQDYPSYSYSPKPVDHFIEELLTDVPPEKRDEIRDRVLERLPKEPDQPDTKIWKEAWLECASKAAPKAEHETQQAAEVVDLACREEPEDFYIADGIAAIWSGYWMESYSSSRAKIIARGLAEVDKPCPGATQLNLSTQRRLRSMAGHKVE